MERKRKMRSSLLVTTLLLLSPLVALAQSSQNGSSESFHDNFLNQLVGDWDLKRTIRGKVVDSTVHAAWVLNHQFLRLDMTDGKTPSQYSAEIFIGYDDAKKHYVIHWIDTWGGSFSETLGYGKRDTDHVLFEFAYPDGAFRNTFIRNEKNDAWSFLMQNSDGSGGWKLFAEDQLTRKKNRPKVLEGQSRRWGDGPRSGRLTVDRSDS